MMNNLPPAPSRGDDPDVFVGKADAWMAALPAFGMEANALADKFNTVAGISALGYQPPVPYGAGIHLVVATQTVQYGANTYAAILAELPFTTAGIFETAKFRLIQGVTATDLAAPEGADGVGVQQQGIGAVLRTLAKKSGDLMTPRDYGGAVDGIADDSAAVARVAAAGADLSMPVVVPKRARHGLALAGVERYKTVWSEPWETDYIAACMNDAYAGLRLDIDCFGDSTMYGSDTANLAAQAPEPAPARLQIVLRRFFANNNIHVRNMAVPGTTVRQMLAGDDHSGATFEARMAASPAKIIYVNHCINSCQLREPADGYKRDLHQVAEIIRKYGKSPIFCTPNPMLPTIIGDRRKTLQLKAYAEAMRQVCREAGVPLVDNFAWITSMIATGDYSMLELLPDGCHPSNFLYGVMGQNMAIPLLCPDSGFTDAQQFLGAMSSQVLGTAPVPILSKNSRLGGAIITDAVGSQNIRMAFVVEAAGLDIYMAIPLWAYGAQMASISVDRHPSSGNFSFHDSHRAGDRFIQDYEVRLLRDAQPGLHFVEFEATSGAVGLYYIRTRKTRHEKVFGIVGQFNYRQRLIGNFEFYPSRPNDIFLFDDIPTPRLDQALRIEASATWRSGAGIVLSGLYTTANVDEPAQLEAGVIVGLDANGYACIWENQGGMYAKLVAGTVNYAGTEQTFYIKATGGRFGTIELYVNSALVGIATLTRPYWGGLLGLWTESATGVFKVDRIDYLNDGQ